MIDQAQIDHDLIVVMNERMRAMADVLESIRQDFAAYKAGVELKLKAQNEAIDALRMSMVRVYAVSGTLATISSVLIKVFWK